MQVSQSFKLARFLPFRLNRLAVEVGRELSLVYAARLGIDVPQWRVLATLASSGPSKAHDIVSSTRTHKSTISRAVKQLVERGWIESRASPEDGRAKRLALTELGRRQVERLVPLVLEFERTLLQRLGRQAGTALDKGLTGLEKTLGLGAEDGDG